MDREDRRRYFVVGSVILEIVTPVFRKKIESDYQNKGIGSFKDFLDHPPILHILFHLRHKNTWCCHDRANCVCNRVLPLNYSQWNLLYSQNPSTCGRLCHCKYLANHVHVDDLDITLASLVLMNCCTLTPNEIHLIEDLRILKNNYLSHNEKGGITLLEYNTLWPDLKNFVLQLDPCRKDDLIRIELRSLDEALCTQYVGSLLDVHKKLDEMDTKMDIQNDAVMNQMDTHNDAVMNRMDTHNDAVMNQLVVHNGVLMDRINKLETFIKRGTCDCFKKNGVQYEPYRLGQDIFTLKHQYNLESVPNVDRIGQILGGVMMDDGRLVICLDEPFRLLICNTDGSEGDSIPLQSQPWDVTAVNNSTVAVTLPWSHCIEMYNINNKHKLKSLPVPEWCLGITTINNKLVVGCDDRRLLMIDDQTGEVVHTVNTDCWTPDRLHTTGDRIFYCSNPFNDNYNLYCYSYTDDRETTLTLPSLPYSITSLQDGSLYVLCEYGSLQHVSSDVQHYKPVNTKGLESLVYCFVFSYNGTQRQLFTCHYGGNVKIFKQI